MKTILITGGAGSLGREFVRYLLANNIIVIDNNEWACAELQKEFPKVRIMLEDFSEWKYEQDPVDIVIHCAAYKHLPMGEINPNSFIDNNIMKTRKLFAEAYKHNADILYISTDKAVEPCSLYGYTKAIGEHLAKHYNGYVARCGNFLGSSGSVIPVWEKCLEEGKPLPVTDLSMKRYVIEIEDAVKQIWEGYKSRKKLIIPEMKEMTIRELIDEVLERHDCQKDYPIEIIGRRDKEKLEEKLKWKWEEV